MTNSVGQCLTFQIRGQVFGIDILHVKEIIEYGGVTKVPLVPTFIHGILNLRGSVVPIVDVGGRFGWDIITPSRLTCIVVTEVEHEGARLHIGLLVDAVNEVVSLTAENLESAPQFGANVRADFIKNIGKIGSKFVLLLDIAKLLDIEAVARSSSGGYTRMAKKILTVDDSITMRRMIKMTLEKSGYKVHEAGDGLEGLSAVLKVAPDLIISDVNMPNMKGIEFVKTLREDAAYVAHKFVPVLMLTTENSDAMRAAGASAGAQSWMQKPFTPDKLTMAVEKLIGEA
ncbi:MAG TPA: chemotaxis protein CheW [Turneriella sp.]|nr:chemotaxis protein CheW [Turneriella sp.]